MFRNDLYKPIMKQNEIFRRKEQKDAIIMASYKSKEKQYYICKYLKTIIVKNTFKKYEKVLNKLS